MNEDNLKIKGEVLDELVQFAASGDKDAFAKIYDVFLTPVYRYIYYKVNRSDVEDLTEVTFYKIWKNLRKYKNKNGSTFSSWVFRIAHNVVMDHYRSHRSLSELPPDVTDTRKENSPVFLAESGLNSNMFRGLIDKLKENYRQIIILKYINQLSNEEIANVMGKRVGGIRVLQFRALNALKELIDKEGITF